MTEAKYNKVNLEKIQDGDLHRCMGVDLRVGCEMVDQDKSK